MVTKFMRANIGGVKSGHVDQVDGDRGMNIASDTSPTHRRQFILGRHEIRAKPEWVSVRLGKDLVLSHCPDLRVVTVADRDGRHWTVLGCATYGL